MADGPVFDIIAAADELIGDHRNDPGYLTHLVTGLVFALRLDEVQSEVHTLRGIAARVRDGWTPVPQHGGPPCWIRSGWHGDIEHDTLTKAEATALYGTEEPSPS